MEWNTQSLSLVYTHSSRCSVWTEPRAHAMPVYNVHCTHSPFSCRPFFSNAVGQSGCSFSFGCTYL